MEDRSWLDEDRSWLEIIAGILSFILAFWATFKFLLPSITAYGIVDFVSIMFLFIVGWLWYFCYLIVEKRIWYDESIAEEKKEKERREKLLLEIKYAQYSLLSHFPQETDEMRDARLRDLLHDGLKKMVQNNKEK